MQAPNNCNESAGCLNAVLIALLMWLGIAYLVLSFRGM